QVESVGAIFVELPVELGLASDDNGYALSQTEAIYAQQQALLIENVTKADVVITTASIPGRRAPLLVTAEMVSCMRSGAVVVDLAAESGGNCEVTRPGETTSFHGVTIIGLNNLPGMLPEHSSQMFSRNITTLLMHLANSEAHVEIDMSDEIVSSTMVCRDGEVVHPRILAMARTAA
ncbi:MAG: NAD(P)(+) transhydrogenase (Re/Si-specific) subunit alpha, partial [Candidatus Latescibacteria bacterium]|nr:NAD(P)(+) transhydrogenase (Re/Si-specific) subunit alpha [Candidatus Latescibacterota bacterium]